MVFTTVTSLKSLKPDRKPYSDAMNKTMYEYLKADRFPRLSFSLEDLVLTSVTNQHGAVLMEFIASGNLAIGGVTKATSMCIYFSPKDDQQFNVFGETTLKMTSFGIQPPQVTEMGRSIKAGDDVRLYFEWTVKPARH